MFYSILTKSFTIQVLFFLAFSVSSIAQERVPAKVSNSGLPASWDVMSKDLKIINDSTKDGAILFSSLRPDVRESGGMIQSTISAPAATAVVLKFKVWVEQIGNGLSMRIGIHNKNDLLQNNLLILDKKNIVLNQWNECMVKVDNYRRLILQGANLLHIQLIVGGNVSLWVKDIQLFADNALYQEERPVPVYQADTDNRFNGGSQIEAINTMDSVVLNNLDMLGKVWGFMKYYHPAVRNGKFNWDYELFKIIPGVVSSRSLQARNKILYDWVASFAYSGYKQDNIDLNDTKKTGFSWMNKRELGDSLYHSLDALKYLNKDSASYYVQYEHNVVIPSHEDVYEYMHFPDPGFRLLTAFRLWNHINYFYAYKNLLKASWDNALVPLIITFLNTKDEHQYIMAFLSTISSFKNNHVTVIGNERVQNMEYLYWGKNWLPAHVKFINGKAYVVRLSNFVSKQSLGLKLGDQIVSLNGVLVKQLIRNQSKYLSGSNPGSRDREYAIKLFRTNDTLMNLIVNRNGKILKLKINTFLTNGNEIDVLHLKYGLDTTFTVLGNNIGYINLSMISDSTLKLVTPRVLNTNGLILDLRGYPVAEKIRTFLNDHFFYKKVAFSRLTYSDPLLPGAFKVYVDSIGKENPSYYKHKVIVLVNEYTQSHAEYLTMMCQQMPNSMIMGSPTSGADGNVVPVRLPGGLITRFESIGVYTTDGKETQGVGLKPNRSIPLDVKSIAYWEDLLLKTALRTFR